MNTAIDSEHTKYNSGTPLHEAGYDSMITARVFLRLTSQLSEKGEHLVDNADTITERSLETKNAVGDKNTSECPSISFSSSFTSGVVIREQVSSEVVGPNRLTETIDTKERRVAVAHATRFDILADQNDEDANSVDTGVDEDAFVTSGGDPIIISKIREGHLIPRLDDKFWRVYGNKLRLFGIDQKFCQLGN